MIEVRRFNLHNDRERAILYAQQCRVVPENDHDALVAELRRELEQVRGDLSIARLQLSARVCSECPAATERDSLAARLEAAEKDARRFEYLIMRGDFEMRDDNGLFVALWTRTRGDVLGIIRRRIDSQLSLTSGESSGPLTLPPREG